MFRRSAAGDWDLEAELFGQNLLSYPTLAGRYIHFGRNVAIEDDVIAITSTRHAGYVTVFERQASGWTERTDLERWPYHPEGEFGLWGLEVSRDWIAVGSILGPQPIPVDYGRVFMFRRDASYPGGWRPTQSLIASNASTNAWGSDGFGARIQIEGRRMAIGAPYARAGPHQVQGVGQAYVFEEAGGAWSEVRRLSAQRIESQAHLMGTSAFGDAVSLHGGVVAVGDWADVQSSGLAGPGRVYLYEEPLGWSHCPGSGATPTLRVRGTPHAGFGSLTLELTQLGGSSICLFAAADVGPATPVGPGPGGLPCLAGPALRLGAVAANSPIGLFQAEHHLELPGTSILAGETWAFQSWCRVPGGTATSNGVALTFQ